MSIAFKEGLTVPPPAMNEIILAANQDIRQVNFTIIILFFYFYGWHRLEKYLNHGCGNTMPDLSDLVPVHSGQVRNLYLLVRKLIQYCISYFDLFFIDWYAVRKTVCILISCLLKKLADLDLHCLH